jgi:hypothetical protein
MFKIFHHFNSSYSFIHDILENYISYVLFEKNCSIAQYHTITPSLHQEIEKSNSNFQGIDFMNLFLKSTMKFVATVSSLNSSMSIVFTHLKRRRWTT